MTTGRTTPPTERRDTARDRRPEWSELLRTPAAIRGGVALLVLLTIYVIGALSHLHVLGL